MIDRKARDQMAATVRSYMEDKITAFELDESIWSTAHSTKDETVKRVGQLLWFHYDDLKNHKIVASKPEWDYFNRLLLLLESEAEGELVRTWGPWRIRNAVAGVCLAGFVLLALSAGPGKVLFLYTLLSGLVSMLLFWVAAREWKQATSSEVAIAPFPSLSSLFFVRRRVPGFSRKRYRQEIASRRIRHPLVEKMQRVPGILLWLIASPIVLVFQTLPDRQFETRIHMPGANLMPKTCS